MDTTIIAAIAVPVFTLITYWIVVYIQGRKNDPLQQQHGGSRESHQNDARGGEVVTNDFATRQNQKHQQRNQKGGAANKARNNNVNNAHANANNSNNNKRYDKEQTYNHPWLASTLKGHTKEIRDMDFSSNGKFLASCAEENLIRRHNSGHRDSTTSDLAASDDVNSSSSNEDLSAAFQPKSNKKSSKSRRNRRQQRKHLMDVDGDVSIKENNNSHNNKRPIIMGGGGGGGGGGSGGVGVSVALNAKPKRKQGNLIAITTIATSANNNNNKGSTTSLSSTSSSSASSSPSQSPTGSPTPRVNNFLKISRALSPPLRQHTKLNLQEHELVKYLRTYIVDQNLLRDYGYPVDCPEYEGCVEIFKCLPRTFTSSGKNDTKYYNIKSNLINSNDGLYAAIKKWDDDSNSQTYDSGRGSGSGSSSPTSLDSDMSEGGEEETATTTSFPTPADYDENRNIFSQYHHAIVKQCVRCRKEFHIAEDGSYLSKENCFYHWGKQIQNYAFNNGFRQYYSCCNGESKSVGCTRSRFHVWSGVAFGLNGPYSDFVRTQPKGTQNRYENSMSSDYQQKVYALDCEMCYTSLGLECTKVTVISCDGQMVYEYFVRPQCEIVDYNTRFSGITEKDLNFRNANVKTLEEVQRDLLRLFDADTILIGHALENDLRVLRIIHHNIIDTSIAFPHSNGFPYRRALKNLTKSYLNRDIQMSDSGHSSFEDSRACLELMLWKVRKEFRLTLEQ